MKFIIHTYGCQMNVRDSEAVEALMVAAGHEAAKSEAEAELVIINQPLRTYSIASSTISLSFRWYSNRSDNGTLFLTCSFASIALEI